MLIWQRCKLEVNQRLELIILLCEFVQQKSSVVRRDSDDGPGVSDTNSPQSALKALMILGQCLPGARPLAGYLAEDIQKLARYVISRPLKV